MTQACRRNQMAIDYMKNDFMSPTTEEIRNAPPPEDLPATTYWLVPTAVGVPLIVRALLRYRTIGAERH
jgi:hypothetical protein